MTSLIVDALLALARTYRIQLQDIWRRRLWQRSPGRKLQAQVGRMGKYCQASSKEQQADRKGSAATSPKSDPESPLTNFITALI
eukprot:CAMPEP_0115053916 /NCGR_PEP_ID=MMETSP0227-20121206/3794_1 /TAXON_ID=89957 /ORGANISM="Polarella glacialis, Strain CCMP 1383" /LENGTH=83 /DNA_ID=CAMNT_0002438313 /DNA_START=1122 /DNA_END=1374 /DNA_ORIENTATION=+